MRSAAVFCLALCQLSIANSICNQNTSFECECDEDCWEKTFSLDTIDWLSVHFIECPPKSLKEEILRKKIAGWINEECGASLNCHLVEGLSERNILIGDFSCERNETRILVLRNASAEITSENALPAGTVGLVLQSREHLLSFLLHSELLEVSVLRRFGGPPPSSSRFWAVLFSCAFLLFLFILLLLVYFSQVYINWKRIVKGKWQSKDYSKVPNVRYSVDEIEGGGHI